MKKHRKWVQTFILLALVAVGAVTLAGGLLNNEAPPAIGSEAPDFELPGLEGGTVRLSDFKGRPVLINFWGTYCPPCVAEMPLIQQYYEQYKDEGLIVLGVNENDPVVTARSFVRQLELTFPILMDRDKVRKAYGVTAYPATFFVSGTGKIIEIRDGEMDEPYLRAVLARLMETER